jgi:C1A family cysteine protease
MTDKIARYGWIPDLPDQRDHLFAAPPPILSALPSQVDLRKGCPPVYDQGQLGSCTANAIGGAIEFDQMKEKLPDVYTPSRLFIYYNERALEGTVNSDGGAQIRDGIKTVASNGACHETLWPYNTAEYANRPPSQAYEDGAKHTTVSYQRVNRDLAQMKGCLAAGSPFVFGFTVYESFESQKVASTGHCPLPGPGEQTVGGHAVLAVGYDDANQWFLVRNSWGANWGMSGYFTLPYTYLTMRSLSSDFWTIRVVK